MVDRGGPIRPIRISDWAEPGLSTIQIPREATCVAAGTAAGALPAGAFHPPNAFSSSGWMEAAVTSPTTTIAEFAGVKVRSWNCARSARLKARTELSVPMAAVP